VKLALLLLLAQALTLAQVPRIGVIDFYGVRTVSDEKLRRALGVREGEALPPSKSMVEERLEQVSGVVRARLEAVCCEDGKAILYVGIEEKGAPHFNFRTPPNSEVRLPDQVVETYRQFLEALDRAVRSGDARDDLTHGHSLMANPECRALQLKFEEFAKGNLKLLREVLRDSADDEHRSVAAYVIGYAEKKRLVVDDLQYAMQDPADSVRNNSMRALAAIAVPALKDPDLGIRVSPTWFIEMLNSIIWTDRNKAVFALVTLTESRDADVLDQIRTSALDSVIEMARWKSLGHALPAFILAGRLAGTAEEEIQRAWSDGEREAVLEKARKSARQRR
jgi:hypothetical protein